MTTLRRIGWALGLALASTLAVAHAVFYWPMWSDDAYISFRYARHLAQGQGLVFNVGERVEGLTNLAWAALLSPWAQGDPLTPAKLIGLGCLAGTVVALMVWARRERLGALGTLVALAPLVAVPYAPFWAVQGLETPAIMLLITLGWSRYRVEADTPGRWPLAALALALAPAFRPDAALVVGLLGAWHLVRPGRRLSRQAVISAIIIAVGAAALVAVKLACFGSILPQTWHTKGGTWPFHRGWQIVLTLVQTPWPAFGVIAALGLLWSLSGVFRRRDRVIPGLVVLTYLTATVIAEKEYFASFRLLVPALPAIGATLGLAARDLGRGPWRRALVAALGLALVGPLPAVNEVQRTNDITSFPHSSATTTWKADATWMTLGLSGIHTTIEQRAFPTAWVIAHVHSGATVSFVDIGLFGFVNDHRVIDPWGLTDPIMSEARRSMAGRQTAAAYYGERVDYLLFGEGGGNLRWWAPILEDDGWQQVESCGVARVFANPRLNTADDDPHRADSAAARAELSARVDELFRRAPQQTGLQVAVARELLAAGADPTLIARSHDRISANAAPHLRFALKDLRCQLGLEPGCEPQPELCDSFRHKNRGGAVAPGTPVLPRHPGAHGPPPDRRHRPRGDR